MPRTMAVSPQNRDNYGCEWCRRAVAAVHFFARLHPQHGRRPAMGVYRSWRQSQSDSQITSAGDRFPHKLCSCIELLTRGLRSIFLTLAEHCLRDGGAFAIYFPPLSRIQAPLCSLALNVQIVCAETAAPASFTSAACFVAVTARNVGG